MQRDEIEEEYSTTENESINRLAYNNRGNDVIRGMIHKRIQEYNTNKLKRLFGVIYKKQSFRPSQHIP